MKSFRDIITESPVGQVGRTKDHEAAEHIENSGSVKKFRKLIKELGGIQVTQQLLNKFKEEAKAGREGRKNKIVDDISESTDTMDPSKFLRDQGYKIKNKKLEKHSFELEFFTTQDTKAAYKELVQEDFLDYYNMTTSGKFIGFEGI